MLYRCDTNCVQMMRCIHTAYAHVLRTHTSVKSNQHLVFALVFLLSFWHINLLRIGSLLCFFALFIQIIGLAFDH